MNKSEITKIIFCSNLLYYYYYFLRSMMVVLFDFNGLLISMGLLNRTKKKTTEVWFLSSYINFSFFFEGFEVWLLNRMILVF